MNKKWVAKRMTINLALQEDTILNTYCAQTGRPATDVIRELIRSLEEKLKSPRIINKRAFFQVEFLALSSNTVRLKGNGE